jgi:hypothetical protein
MFGGGSISILVLSADICFPLIAQIFADMLSALICGICGRN